MKVSGTETKSIKKIPLFMGVRGECTGPVEIPSLKKYLTAEFLS